MSELHVYRNDVIDWVIAESPEDANEVWAEHSGEASDEPYEWVRLPDEQVLFVDLDDGRAEKTCADWVREHGRGFLCSTEY